MNAGVRSFISVAVIVIGVYGYVLASDECSRQMPPKAELSKKNAGETLDNIKLFGDNFKTTSVIRAKVEKISIPIEDISRMNYPDCFISCIVSCLGILHGSDECPPKILVYLPEIANRKRIGALPKPGDVVDIKIISYSNLPDRIRQIQCNDTIAEFDVEEYVGVILSSGTSPSTLKSVKAPKTAGGKKIRGLPRKPDETEKRKQQLEEDLITAKKEFEDLQLHLSELNDFVKRNTEILKRCADHKDKSVIINHDGMNFRVFYDKNPFLHSDSRYLKGVDSLRALQSFLDKSNIDLIIVPVPERQTFNYAMAFDATKKYKSLEYAKMLYDLRKEGFEVLDIWGGAQQHILPCETPFNLSNHYPQDIAQIGGYLLAQRLKRYGYQKEEFLITPKREVIKKNNPSRNEKRTPSFFTIGNSFGYNPVNASIRHFGCYYANAEIDNHNIGDGHLYFGRQLLRHPDYLDGKKACILIVSFSHLALLENIDMLQNINTVYPHRISFDSASQINDILSPHLDMNSSEDALLVKPGTPSAPAKIFIAIPPEISKSKSSGHALILKFKTGEKSEIPIVTFKIGKNNTHDDSKPETGGVFLRFTKRDIIDNKIELNVRARHQCAIQLKSMTFLWK